MQRSKHERRPDGSSQTDGWDQELVIQINSVKVSICTMMEKRRRGEGEVAEENVKAVLNGAENHIISLSITDRSGVNTRIKTRNKVEEKTKPREPTQITKVELTRTPMEEWNELGECFITTRSRQWTNHQKSLELDKQFCGGIGRCDGLQDQDKGVTCWQAEEG